MADIREETQFDIRNLLLHLYLLLEHVLAPYHITNGTHYQQRTNDVQTYCPPTAPRRLLYKDRKANLIGNIYTLAISGAYMQGVFPMP